MGEYLQVFAILLIFIGIPVVLLLILLWKHTRIALIVIAMLVIGFILFIYPRPFKTSHLEYLLPENSKNIKADFKYAGLYDGCQMEGYSISKAEYEKGGNGGGFSPWFTSIRDKVPYKESYIYIVHILMNVMTITRIIME